MCIQQEESFIAVVEVCGFNDWRIRMLWDDRCHKVILIQPEERKRCKTDRRDAAALSELLWVNRDRFLEGKPVLGLRQVDVCSAAEQFLISLLDDREPEFTKDEVGFAAAELFGLENAADGITAGQPDDRFGSVALPLVDQFITDWFSEGMIDSSVEVGQRSENVFPRQPGWNGLRHSIPPANDRPQDIGLFPKSEV